MSRIAHEKFDRSPTRASSIEDVLQQIEVEYLEMPGLSHHGSAGAAAMGARQHDVQTRLGHAGPARHPATHPAGGVCQSRDVQQAACRVEAWWRSRRAR